MAMSEPKRPKPPRRLHALDNAAHVPEPGPGRPTKMTRLRVTAILAAIRSGAPIKIAVRAAGVGLSTFYTWMSENPEFRDRIEIAEAQCVTSRMRRIERAGKAGAWTADMTVLERRYPEHFGRRDRVDITVYQQVRSEAERIAAELGMSIEEVLEGSGVAGALPAEGDSSYGD